MAKWSDIWSNGGNKWERKMALYVSRNTRPAPAKSTAGGKYPHLQQFGAKKSD